MTRRKIISFALLLITLASLWVATTAFARGPIQVTGNASILSGNDAAEAAKAATLTEFIGLVKNGDPASLVGVFVPGVLALPVIQQPNGNAGYVSEQGDTVTQFRMASQYGTTGLLAHNTLSGALFFDITKNDKVILVYGDGKTRQYLVERINQYQALSPSSPYSDFLDLSEGTQRISASELFNQVYRGQDQVVFQTCIYGEGDPSWGRLFITATPYTQPINFHIHFPHPEVLEQQ